MQPKRLNNNLKNQISLKISRLNNRKPNKKNSQVNIFPHNLQIKRSKMSNLISIIVSPLMEINIQ